jgi:LacI family transcriptional regulator
VTISQVAALAGVSPTTVSHVLSGKRAVGAAVAERVHGAVQTLGYRPNHVARSLRTRRSQMIAVIVPDLTNHFYSVLARGLADAVDGAGYGTYVCNTDALAEREDRLVEDALDRGVDGVVISPVNGQPEGLPVWQTYPTPFVCLGDSIDSENVDRVMADDEEASREITAHLIARGARRVAMVQGPPGASPGRVAGYRRALEEAGLRYDDAMVVAGYFTREGGREATSRLLRRDPAPDAIFCLNDLMAIGAMSAARERGVDIPGQLLLAGFDDVEAAALVTPSLTTVENPSYEAGWRSGELLLSRMSGEYTGPRRTVVLPCRVVLRESG